MFGKLQEMHQNKQNDVGARPTRLPPTKHGRTSHPDLQKPFCSNPQRGRRQVPALAVVPPRTTGRTHRQLTATKQRGPEDFSLCTRSRTARLHAKTVRTSGMLGHGARETKKQEDVGHPRRSGIQHRHIDGTPPLFPRLHCQNESNKS